MEKQKVFNLEQKIAQLALERLENQVSDALAVCKQQFHQAMDLPSGFPDMTIGEVLDAIGQQIVQARSAVTVETAVDQALEQLGYQLGYVSRAQAQPPFGQLPNCAPAAPWQN